MRPSQTAATRAWFGVFASVLWALCFRIGVQRDLLYSLLTPAAVLLMAATGWLSPPSFRWPDRRQLGLGIGVGVSSVAATQLGLALVGEYIPGLLTELVRLQQLASAQGAAVMCVVIIATAEEFIWREGLQGAWLLRWSHRPRAAIQAVVASALVYGMAQSGPQSLWLVATAVAFGVLWGALRWWSGSLWPSLVAHLMWTIANVVIWPVGR